MDSSLQVTVLLAIVVSLIATDLARNAARHFDWLDHPNRRKVHTTPIPLLGGIAIYLAFLAAVLLANARSVLGEGLAVLVAASLLVATGAVDDQRGLGPRPKLLVQVLATILLIIGGIHVDLFGLAWLNYALTLLWVIGICNAMNLLDNMDGLAGGTAAIACAFFVVLAVLQGQIWVSLVAAALLGSTLGFLRYNWNPATIFMGDAGSLLLGFLLAVVGLKLRFPYGNPEQAWMIPILVLALPICDTTLVTISRLRRGISIASGGRDHISHRLVRLGLSMRQAVAVLYLAAVLCGLAALVVALTPSVLLAYVLAGLLGVAALGAIVLLERVDLTDTGQMPSAGRARVALRQAER